MLVNALEIQHYCLEKVNNNISMSDLMFHYTCSKPYINGMMTKKWLITDEDFTEVTSRIESYSGLCKSMRNPTAQVNSLSAQRPSLKTHV